MPLSVCICVRSGWHDAAIVSSGKHVTNPDMNLNSCTRSLAHVARAVTPLRDFKRSETVCVEFSCGSLIISRNIPRATSNNCTRHDFTSSAGIKSVRAVTSSSVGIRPSCTSMAAMSPSMSCDMGHSRGVKRLWRMVEDDIASTDICLFISSNRWAASDVDIIVWLRLTLGHQSFTGD